MSDLLPTALTTQALLIDVQERLWPAIEDQDALLSALQLVVKGLSLLNIPLHITEQYPQGLGETIPDLHKMPELIDKKRYTKTAFSCLGCDALRSTLAEDFNRKTILLMGVEAHICVLQTAIDLEDAGYTPVWITDTVGARRVASKRLALDEARRRGHMILDAEALLFGLMKDAKHPHFKPISALVKASDKTKDI